MEDASNIICRRSSFVSQTNNWLYYFRKPTSRVKNNLFRPYSYIVSTTANCGHWHPNSFKIFINLLHGAKELWNSPHSTHRYLILLICNCPPIFEETCRLSIGFPLGCILHESGLIKKIPSYGMYYARNESTGGQNVLLCTDTYCPPLHRLFLISYYIVGSYLNSTKSK
jgi:hypothetical protein